MKANELRIGNWVDIEAIDIQVECLPIDYNYSHLHPIPLTEEWLVKFGFDTDGVTFDKQVPFVFHYGYRFSLYNTGNAVDFNRSGWAVRVFQSKQTIEIGRIQYVHQLQNLYFALTGEELNKQDQ